MISFIWPPGVAMFAGTGGSETFTAGHVRELMRRGIETQVVTIGHGLKDGRKDFTDIPFLSMPDASGISQLTGTVVFMNQSYAVATKNKAALFLHCAVPKADERKMMQTQAAGKTIIANSIYNAQQWALFLNIPASTISIVLPFADPIFGNAKRTQPAKRTRIVYAGRLHPDKGIYTVLEMMHSEVMRKNGHRVNIVTAGQHVEEGQTIARMLKDYSYAKLLPAEKTVLGMAELLVHTDVLLVPSVFAEPFGMLSVEAQHAGCRVVASNIGGLPETNCGLLTLVEPRDPVALMIGIEQAVALGPATKKERDKAKDKFMLDVSVDSLLVALRL